MKQKTFLMNDRIQLRAVEPADLDVMYNLENDPTMWDVSSFTVPYSRYVLQQYIEQSQCDVFADKQLRLMITHRDDRRVIGVIDLTDFAPLHGRAAVGIAIHQDFRQQGYAIDALELLCQYAFDFLSLKQLYAHIPAHNEASLKLFAHCGFEPSGRLKDWIRTEESFQDVVMVQRINSKKK